MPFALLCRTQASPTPFVRPPRVHCRLASGANKVCAPAGVVGRRRRPTPVWLGDEPLLCPRMQSTCASAEVSRAGCRAPPQRRQRRPWQIEFFFLFSSFQPNSAAGGVVARDLEAVAVGSYGAATRSCSSLRPMALTPCRVPRGAGRRCPRGWPRSPHAADGRRLGWQPRPWNHFIPRLASPQASASACGVTRAPLFYRRACRSQPASKYQQTHAITPGGQVGG